jgi:F-type H+-transporting ATPase subunit b
MEKLLNVSPGLLFWTIFNFLLFLFVFIKLFKKPILDSLKTREEYIRNAIESAEKDRDEAKQFLIDAEARIVSATKEVNAMISKERETAAEIIAKAKSEAERVRQDKLDNAVREIKIAQEHSFKELKQEIAGLVVKATEKIIEVKLTTEKDFELINEQIDKLSKN